jgi:Ca2+/Na+ antiporter
MTVFTAIIELTKASWHVLRRHPRLMWFPILSLLATLAVFTVLGPILAPHLTPWLAVLAFVFAMYFVHVFFAVALTSQALKALRGEEPITIAGGIEVASTRAPAIASFAAVTGSIGFVLEAMGRSNSPALRFARAVFGTGWSLVTYLAIPVMVQERRGGIPSLRRSGDLFKRTWGETTLSEVGLRVFTQYLMVLLVLLAVLLIHVFGESVLALLLILALAGAAIGLVGSLEAIYRAALYVFASEGVVPEPFDRAELDAVWRTKPADPTPPIDVDPISEP